MAIALALGGCGSSSPPTVSAASYVRQVCVATKDFRQQSQGAVARYRTAASSARSVADVKQELETYLASIVTASDKFVAQVKAAGTPAVANGKQFAATLLSGFEQVRSAFGQAESQVRQVPSNSAPALRSAASAVRAILAQANAKVGNLGLTGNAQLHQATLKDPTCQALRSGA
jgi:hypothetical protein